MHRFWIKTCNLILVVALLFGYQAVVQSRAQKETIAELEYELQQKTVSLEEQLKENHTTLNEVASENKELKKQIAALQEQLSKSNDNQ